MVLVLKTREGKTSVGSNPTLTVSKGGLIMKKYETSNENYTLNFA